MIGIEVAYGNKTKRICENVLNYIHLITLVKKLFNLENELLSKFMYLYYLDSDKEKFEISSEEDFLKIMNRGGDILIKFEIQYKSLKDSLDVDEILSNMKLSESFTMIDKQELSPNTTNTFIKIEDQDEISKKEREENSNEIIESDKKSLENNNQLNVIGSINKKNYEELNSKMFNIETMSDTDNHTDNDLILIRKIDEILTSRLKLMEDNFKGMLDDQQSKINAKIDQHEQGYNNLQINKINLEIKNNQQNEAQIIQNELDVRSQNKIIHSSDNQLENIFISLEDKNSEIDIYGFDEYCSACKFQILKNKYVCVMCHNFILCSLCEETHLEHPLMRVNIKNNSITTKEELIDYCIYLNKNKGLLKNEIQTKGKLSNTNYFIWLDTKYLTNFAMAAGSSIICLININNLINENIEENIYLSAVNNKKFKVNSKIIEQLRSKSIKEVEIFLESPEELGTYEFEIIAHCKIFNRYSSNGVKFLINVVPSEDVDEANANILFARYDEIMKLSKDKKIILWKMIIQGLIRKRIEEIIQIIMKYNYDIMAGIDELTE